MNNELKIVKDFVYGSRRCIVVLIDKSTIREHFAKQNIPSTWQTDYHNGYVEISDLEFKENVQDYDFCEEITYNGDLSHLDCANGKKYIGFDTAHSYNYENPKTQTAEHVEKQLKKIVKQLNKNKIEKVKEYSIIKQLECEK